MQVFVVILTNKYEGIMGVEGIYREEATAKLAVAELTAFAQQERLDGIKAMEEYNREHPEDAYPLINVESYDYYTYFPKELL